MLWTAALPNKLHALDEEEWHALDVDEGSLLRAVHME
jgi:hypothetical protein